MTKKTTAAKPAALKRTPVAAAAKQTAAPIEGGGLPPVLAGDLLEPASSTEIQKQVAEIAAKTGAPILTPEHIQRVIVDEVYTRIEGTFTTICTLTLRNGANVCGINYGPVSPENYSQELACEMAYKAAFGQVWPLEGYLLREFLAAGKAKSELNPIGEIAKACHVVLDAYESTVANNRAATAWEDLSDERRTALIDRVAAELNGAPVEPILEDTVCARMVSALVHTLAGGRHG